MNNDFATDPDRGCAPGKVDPKMFFSQSPLKKEQAKQVCLGCPVRSKCDAWARERKIQYGVWAGVDRDDKSARRRRARQRAKAAMKP